MLKQLIALFAETFLTNKKEWISTCSTAKCKPTDVVVVSYQNVDTYQNFTAPANGYFLIRGCPNTAYIDVPTGQGLINEKVGLWKRFSARVAKGDTISFWVYGGETASAVEFYPDKGN